MHNLFGRTQIFCDSVVTLENLKDTLTTALVTHEINRSQIEYLYDYYKGKQAILDRQEPSTLQTCNRIVINRANEIVSFKDGYLIGEPVQYVSRGDGKNLNDNVNKLNAYMAVADKSAEDMDLVNWMHICGVGFRLVLPNKKSDEALFSIYTLDPRNTFVVYLNDVAKTPQFAVNYVEKLSGEVVYTCYFKDMSVEVTKSPPQIETGETVITTATPTSYKSSGLPITEYPANKERLGVFEKVLPLLDALNLAQSDRLDGLDMFIQSILCFVGVDIEEEQLKRLLHLRTIAVPLGRDGSMPEVKYLVQELNQQQTQVLIDDMYDAVLEICGMPSRSGGASTSDTGAAVILREGWSSAEGRAKVTELMFKRADKEMLKNVLNILRVNSDVDLTISDIEIKFSRHNYEGLTVKSNALNAMLNNSKIHPLDAYQQSNLFVDSEAAYNRGMKYYESVQQKIQEGVEANENAANVGTNGDNTNTEAGE